MTKEQFPATLIVARSTICPNPLSDEPGTLYAVLKTTSLAEKWETRIRLLFSGCKVKNLPKLETLDKYDVFSLLVGFDPGSVTQTRIVMARAKLDHLR